MENAVVLRPGRLALLALLLLVGISPVARAGEPYQRQGFWGRLGVGVGSRDFHADQRLTGVTGALVLGGTLSEHVRMAAEVSRWQWSVDRDVGEDQNHLERVWHLSCAVYLYPRVKGGFFVKTGAGFSSFTEKTGRENSDEGEKGLGGGLIAGVGYDIPILRLMFLTPEVSYSYGLLVDDSVDGAAHYTQKSVLEVRLALTLE